MKIVSKKTLLLRCNRALAGQDKCVERNLGRYDHCYISGLSSQRILNDPVNLTDLAYSLGVVKAGERIDPELPHRSVIAFVPRKTSPKPRPAKVVA
jgi:hypothetical protein